MTLVKTSILSFIATAIKMIAGLVINKAVAVYIGPAGLALVGQFQNFSQLVMTAAQGAINSGVTKYAAEYGKDNDRIPILFSTAAIISLFSSVAVGTGIVLFSNYASLHFLKSEDYSYVFVIFGFTIVLFVINNLLLSILNGLKEIKAWVMINIIQSIYSLIFTTLLIVFLGLDGALIALVTNQSVIFLIVLWMLRKHQVIKLSNFKCAFDKPEAKKLGGFALMTAITMLTVPVSLIIVREIIIRSGSLEEAGYWQAMWYMSLMYLMVFMTVIKIYFLPKLSELLQPSQIRNELINGFILFLPILIVLFVVIYYLRDYLLIILFSPEFQEVSDLFYWQLIGDFFKLAGTFFGILLAAKAKHFRVILVNVLFSISFVIFAYFYYADIGIEGVVFAHFVNNVFYFVFVILISLDLVYGKQKFSVNNNTDL
ncbi:MAG: O-antigen translocase [Methyloprofundus sp.]|nr:O-antigen translocase [Methyloprofundus sp.]